jgi:hypothetical protein
VEAGLARWSESLTNRLNRELSKSMIQVLWHDSMTI